MRPPDSRCCRSSGTARVLIPISQIQRRSPGGNREWNARSWTSASTLDGTTTTRDQLWDEDAECEGFGTAARLALLRPIQPLLMTRTTLEAQRRRTPGERAFTVTRAGCPGIQRYAQTWSGDNSTSWDLLRWNLRTCLQMSLSGIYNTGHDIGGFSGPIPDPELLIRWTQAGVVHPRFIMNSWKPEGVYNAPWLHLEALPVIREAIRLRYRLIPYLYSLIHAAVAAHEPILRPCFLEFEDDPVAVRDCEELMLGPFDWRRLWSRQAYGRAGEISQLARRPV